MFANDENSGPSIRKGKRRSSILKVPKSPGYVLDDIDPNAENVDEFTAQKSKKARRSSSRRVSFAETCQVKEIPNKVLEKMNSDGFAINEGTSVPPPFLNLESTRDNSVYRPPASTLAGLPSLLTSPIQESPPERSTFRECSLENNDGQLDFTRSHVGGYIEDNQTTALQDTMEMTMNYEGWEFEQSTVLTRQVVASKVAIANHGQMQKLNASNFLDQLKANDSSKDFERRNSYDTLSRNEQCPKRDGTSFLNELKASSNSSFQPEHQRDSFSTEAHSTFPTANTFPRTRPGQSSKVDQSLFLSQLQATSNTSQQRVSNNKSSLPQSNFNNTTMRKEDNLDFTQCVGNGFQEARLKSSNDVTCDEMEMTANYGNWMATPADGKSKRSLSGQRSIQTNNGLDFTRCYRGNIEQQHYDDEDMTGNQMEMTRNYQNWEEQRTYMVPLQRNDISDKRSPEKDDSLEYTHCHVGNIEMAQFQTVDEDITVNMEMTRNYENWEQEKLNSVQLRTPRNENNLHFISKRSLEKDHDNLEFTRCQTGRIEICQSGTVGEDVGASQMEMTRNYENWQEEKSNSNYHPQNKRSPEKEDNLEFTRCQPGRIEFSQFGNVDEDVVANQMEMTRNYENWQEEKSNIIPASRNENTFHSGNKRSPEKDDNLEFTRCQSGRIEFSQTGIVDEDVVVNQMEMTRNYENWQGEKSKNENSFHSRNKSSPEKDGNLEITLCQAGRIEFSQSATLCEDIGANQMEMTRNYENWQTEKSNIISASRNENSFYSINKRSPEKGDNLELTRCQPGDIEIPQSAGIADEGVGANQMEMTRNYENWQEKKSNSNFHSRRKRSPEKDDNLEFTRCQRGRIEFSQSGIVDGDVVANRMEMTRNYEHWEHEKSMEPQMSTNANTEKVCEKISDVSRSRLGDDLDRTTSEKITALRNVHIAASQTSIMVNSSGLEKLPENQTSMMNLSRQLKMSENQTCTKPVVPRQTDVEKNETCLPKVVRREEESETQKSMINMSTYISGIQTSITKRHLEISDNQTSLVKAVPRATSSKITIDKNFKRFEIKMPTSRTSKISLFQSEEKHSVIKSEEKASKVDVNIASKAPSDQDVTITSEQLPHVIDGGDQKQEEMKVSPVVIDEQANADSTVDLSLKSVKLELNDTEAKTEHIEAETPECNKDSVLEEKPDETAPHEPYTLRKFMYDAGISFHQHRTRRSETPLFRSEIPKDLKDKIYFRCLSDAKLEIMEDFAEQLQKGIAENEKLFAGKEKELDANNPPVFAKLKKVLGTENEDLVVDVVMRLKRTGETRGKRLLYDKKKEMRKSILASLQEQEKKLSSELLLINKHKSELDEDINMLDKVEADCDKQILELEATLESEEKEWAEYIKDTNELKHKLETLELELKSKEEERGNLLSVQESLTTEIAEQKKKMTELQSAIEKIAEEKKLRELKDEEIRKFLPFQTALQEWILEKYDETSLKFVFLGKTLDLDVVFEDGETIKDIQLSSQISELSIPLALLGHKLIMEKFATYDLLAMFPTRKKFLQLLHQLSVACIRVRLLLETMTKFSINHIVSVNEKILTVEFSSLSKFMKFILNFDLSKLVTDGNIPFTVDRKIGSTSADAIAEEINKFPSSIIYLPKILKSADQMMSALCPTIAPIQLDPTKLDGVNGASEQPKIDLKPERFVFPFNNLTGLAVFNGKVPIHIFVKNGSASKCNFKFLTGIQYTNPILD